MWTTLLMMALSVLVVVPAVVAALLFGLGGSPLLGMRRSQHDRRRAPGTRGGREGDGGEGD